MFLTPIQDFKLKFEQKDGDGTKWYSLKYPMIYEHKGIKYEVPAHTFFTDVASIPTFFQRWFKPLGKYSRSSVLHDYICDEKHITYFDKHWIYYKAMKEDGVKRTKAGLFFVSVLSFYWLHDLLNK